MKAFEKQWQDHPIIAAWLFSLLDAAVYSPLWGCGLASRRRRHSTSSSSKSVYQDAGKQKGEKSDSQIRPHVCSCQRLPIWLFWRSHLNKAGECEANTKAADGALLRKWVAKVLPPDMLWLINVRTQSSWAGVLAGNRVDSDKTMCWRHLHNFLDALLSAVFWVEHCLSKTSFITVSFLLQKIVFPQNQSCGPDSWTQFRLGP